jgi:type IV pilus assembly protein PilX
MRRSASLHGRYSCGASLLTSLILLAVIMLLGSTTARLTVQGEKAARNERDFRTAFHSAEAALLDAQLDIDGGEEEDAIFLPPDRSVFLPGCGREADGDAYGLCASASASASAANTPVWLAIDLLDENDATARTVAYGGTTGRHFSAGAGALPDKLPRYLIELLSSHPETPPVAGEAAQAVYRITAIGFGMRPSTHVVLQAVYRRERMPNELAESEEGPLYRYRSHRLSWREIPHWQELRDASKKK